MKAGRELDVFIAEKVMGLRNIRPCEEFPGEELICYDRPNLITGLHTITDEVPHYSTDIAAAWEVQAKFPRVYIERDIAGGWTCEIWSDDDLLVTRKEADTAPIAICLAALEAIFHFFGPRPPDL